jgi:2-iminoacetate synthase ThiH
VSSLEVIARVAEEYGHIQECIIQPHRLGPRQRRQGSDQSFDLHRDLPQVMGAQGCD